MEEEHIKFLGQLNENPLEESHIYQGLPLLEEESVEGKIVIMMVLEGHVEIGDPLKKEDILTKVEGPLTEKDTLIEDLLEEDILIEIGDPLEDEDNLAEDPLIEMEDPLMMEDPWRWRTPWTSCWTRTTRPSRTTWTSKAYHSTNSPGDAGYISFRKYF